MRLNAYILAADPTWLRTSVMRYYDAIDRLVVSYDRHGRGWTGAPVDVHACLAALREVDRDNKVVRAPGDFCEPGLTPTLADTRQRQAALELAGEGADWVLQLDTDEVLPSVEPLLDVLREAADGGIPAVEWPMRVLYRRLAPGRYLQVVTEDGNVHVEYPGAIAVRPGTPLVDCRRSAGPFIRPVPRSGAGGLQLARRPEPQEVRAFGTLGLEDVIVHNSWARSRTAVHAKVAAWGHNQGLRTHAYYFATWLPARHTWRALRDFHPFARGLWPRLAPYNLSAISIHSAEENQ